MSLGFAHEQRFLEHETGPGHPERPERLRSLMERLGEEGLLQGTTRIPVSPLDAMHAERLHQRRYLERLRRACAQGASFIDTPDSGISESSHEIAFRAAGAVVNAADAVVRDEARRAFCAIRPPGHHAEQDRSMGFCLLNNIAIAAEHLLRDHGFERVAIVDFDVHHGNGTQHLFESRGDVLFISAHEDPRHQYPGTGYPWECGRGEGEGATLNVPLEPGQGDEAYQEAFERQILPKLDAFRPQMLLLSSGFDPAAADPLAHMHVTPDGFAWISTVLREAADRLCDGRLLSVLEGGYDLEALAQGAARHVRVLANREHEGSAAAA